MCLVCLTAQNNSQTTLRTILYIFFVLELIVLDLTQRKRIMSLRMLFSSFLFCPSLPWLDTEILLNSLQYDAQNRTNILLSVSFFCSLDDILVCSVEQEYSDW